ncbi:MAG: protein kinase [Planctomyces sp.]|nr:protein kinase [Planctomyces sp.]
MLPKTTEALIDLLLQLRLVEQRHLTEALGVAPSSPEQFLGTLERRQLLTSLQIERLKKGDTDGLVLGDYKLMYRNASGSFARVYRACSISTGRMVGLKLLRERWSSDREVVQLFHREGEIGQRLKHPNIVPVYDCLSQGRFHFITMEFVEGGNLRDFLKIRKRLQPAEACRFTLDMARALEYALSFGYTHRDLKMTNVLMSSHGVAKLIDFGLAADDSVFSRVGGQEMQTALEYATLEKHTNAPRNDPRSDLYFLGGILFELLTGEPPYPRTKDRDERKRFGRYRDVKPVTSVDPALPLRVAAVVDRLMQTSPNDRFQSPAAVVMELQSVLAELGDANGSRGPADSGIVPQWRDGGMSESGIVPRLASQQPTVLCVESRPKHQDVLRDYFSRHGFRLLLLSDLDRAIQRIRSQPPDCLLLMGDVVGDRVAEEFPRMMHLGRERRMAGVVVLTEEQSALQKQLRLEWPWSRVLVQPVTLRDLRKQLDAAVKARAAE